MNHWLAWLINRMQGHQHTGSDGSASGIAAANINTGTFGGSGMTTLPGGLTLGTKGIFVGYSTTITSGGTYDGIALNYGLVFLFAYNGSNPAYYNSAIVANGWDGTNGPAPVIIGQNQTGGSGEQFYIGGVTGLVISNPAGVAFRIKNNFGYSVIVYAVALSLG